MNYEAVYRTAPATPGLLITTLLESKGGFLRQIYGIFVDTPLPVLLNFSLIVGMNERKKSGKPGSCESMCKLYAS